MPDGSRATLRMSIRADARTRELLERLRDDQAFRDRLVDDPAGALAEFGVPAEDVPAEVELPSRKDLDRLLADASEPDAFGVVDLPPRAGKMLRYFLRPLAGAMPLVPADGQDHAG